MNGDAIALHAIPVGCPFALAQAGKSQQEKSLSFQGRIRFKSGEYLTENLQLFETLIT
jgi:hypothetical protein